MITTCRFNLDHYSSTKRYSFRVVSQLVASDTYFLIVHLRIIKPLIRLRRGLWTSYLILMLQSICQQLAIWAIYVLWKQVSSILPSGHVSFFRVFRDKNNTKWIFQPNSGYMVRQVLFEFKKGSRQSIEIRSLHIKLKRKSLRCTSQVVLSSCTQHNMQVDTHVSRIRGWRER